MGTRRPLARAAAPPAARRPRRMWDARAFGRHAGQSHFGCFLSSQGRCLPLVWLNLEHGSPRTSLAAVSPCRQNLHPVARCLTVDRLSIRPPHRPVTVWTFLVESEEMSATCLVELGMHVLCCLISSWSKTSRSFCPLKIASAPAPSQLFCIPTIVCVFPSNKSHGSPSLHTESLYWDL